MRALPVLPGPGEQDRSRVQLCARTIHGPLGRSTLAPTISYRSLGLFLVVTLGLPWLIFSPYLLGFVEPKGMVFFGLLVGCMFVPTLGTLAVTLSLERGPGLAARLGLNPPSLKRLALFGGVALVVPIQCAFAAPLIGHALGWYAMDLSNLSGYKAIFRAQIEAGGGEADPLMLLLKPGMLIVLLFVSALLGSFFNVIATIGEEIGWRGWLLPHLMPLGAWPAMILSGLIWGIWHAPMILLGHNYPQAPILGVFLFLGFCVIWGILHGWVRLASGSVWPAALMHGAVNASAGFIGVLHLEGSVVDPVWVGLTGISGWILPASLVLVLGILGVIPGTFRADAAVE